MSERDQYASRPDIEFLSVMRAADKSIIGDMAVAAYEAVMDHQKMKDVVYELVNNRDDSMTDPRVLGQLKKATDLAGELEIHGEPIRIGEVVRRYVARTPEGRHRSGQA